VSKRIVGCALTVSTCWELDLVRKSIKRTLVHGLRKSGFAVSQKHPMDTIGPWPGNIPLIYSSNTPSLPSNIRHRPPLRVLRDLRFHFPPAHTNRAGEIVHGVRQAIDRPGTDPHDEDDHSG
jgi:hypothetical protein